MNIDDKVTTAAGKFLNPYGSETPITALWYGRLKNPPLVFHRNDTCTTTSRLTLGLEYCCRQAIHNYFWVPGEARDVVDEITSQEICCAKICIWSVKHPGEMANQLDFEHLGNNASVPQCIYES